MAQKEYNVTLRSELNAIIGNIEKDKLMVAMGFIVVESRRFYYLTLSRYKTLYVDYVKNDVVNGVYKSFYDVYTVSDTGLVKVLQESVSFNNACLYVQRYLEFLERIKKK